MSTPEIMALFNRLRRLPAAQRESIITAEAGTPEMQREIESLLRAHDEAGPFLDAPLVEIPATPPPRDLPDTIAGYDIEGLIGHGGMGSVYQARHAATGRFVALKVIRSTTPPRTLLRRFAREAVILGRLRHPHIAQVYDAGVHREGRWRIPYLVMERVEGRSILAYADEDGLSRDERTELLATVCDAVHYAHQQGVIHRDLKPSNVLVDESSGARSPKVLDFGVARLIDGEGGEATVNTGTGQLVGTLRYMSPEQALGTPDDVDTRSDVHALGMIGFELLAGQRPYEVDEHSIAAALDSIRNAQPRRPESIDHELAGDLGIVLMTAIERDPARRYQSASEMASDLRRVLAQEPIAARAPSALYHARKFAARHRGLVATVLIVVAMVVTAAAIATTEAVRANRARAAEAARFEDVRALAATLLFEFDPHLIDLPGSLPARRLLVSTGLEYLDRLANDAGSRSDLLLDVARGYNALGSIQSHSQRPNVGDTDGALASHRKALSVLDALPPRHDRAFALALRFQALVRIGDALIRKNRPEDALVSFGEAAAVAEERIARTSDDVTALRDRSLAWQRLARVHNRLGNAAQRDDYRDRANSSLLDLVEAYPDHAGLLRDLAITRLQEGRTLFSDGYTDAAIAEFQSFVALAEDAAGRFPDRVIARRDLAIACQYLGDAYQSKGHLDDAEAQYRRELALKQGLSDADPDDVGALAGLAPPLCNLGELALAREDHESAREFFARYLEVARACARLDPSGSGIQRELGVALYKLGELEERLGSSDAAGWYEACLRHFTEMRDRGLLWATDEGVFDDIRAHIAATTGTPE